MELLVVDITQVEVGKRFREDLGDIRSMVDSFKREGIIQPLAVRHRADGTFDLMAGGRRYAAALEAGLTQIPVRAYPADTTDIMLREIELIENVYRKDLTWYEATQLKAEIHRLKIAQFGEKTTSSPHDQGWTVTKTAELLGVSQALVSDELQLAKAVEMFPQLREAKTKLEASKQLNQIREDLVRKELAKRVEAKAANLHTKLLTSYHVQDFFDWVRTVPDASVDLVEVDPPYGIDLQSVKRLEYKDNKLETYNEVAADDYVDFLTKVCEESYRIMKPDSWLIMWFAMHPWFDEVYCALDRAGFITRMLPAMWYKGGGNLQTMQPGLHLASAYEPFFYARKGNPSIVRQGRGNVFNYKPVNSQIKIHPTERPIEMMQDILATFGWAGSRVVVPFAGSGNTLLAAANLGMEAEGCDLNQQYKDAYIIRVAGGSPGKYKSYKEETNGNDKAKS